MTEPLERARAKRRGHRGVCTKLQHEVDELIHQEDKDITQHERLNTIKTVLEDKTKTLDNLDEIILDICDVGDIEHEIEESTEVTRRILSCLSTIENFQRNCTSKPANNNESANQIENSEENESSVPSEEHQNTTNANVATASASSTPSSIIIEDTSPTNESSNSQQEGNENPNAKNSNDECQQKGTSPASPFKAKLPKLTLPKFNGEVTKWNTFWDSFRSAIHGAVGMPRIDKFNYLNSLLEGAAARAIQGLPITNENYEHAIELLVDRFGRPQQIISAHMDEILKIPSANGERTTSLRFIYDKVSVHVRGLASLGVSADQYGSLLIPIIMSKLPSEIKLQIARKSSNTVWNIEELLDTIKIELEAREVSEGASVTNTNTRASTTTQRNKPTASTLVSNEASNAPHCVYCNGRHYSASCESIKDIERRKTILKDARRCFNCLSKSHISPNCSSNKRCRKCQGRHHQSICTKGHNFNNATTPTTTQVTNTQNMEENATTTVSGLNKGTVLLQTASAVASNGPHTTQVRVLFDTGSQRSYITTDLAKKLNLQPVRKEKLHLNTFGDDKFKRQSCDVYKLNLRGRHSACNESVELTAIKFPVICSPIRPPTHVDYPHLQGLEFADYECQGNVTTTIDVLIGADHYWDFVIGDTIGGDGPTAVKSKFGWLLSGHSAETSNDKVVTNLVINGDNPAPPVVFENDTDELIDSLRHFWQTESIGITDDCPRKMDIDDSRQFIRDIRFNGERYEVGLPWKESFTATNDMNDFKLCRKRLKSLHNKLKNDRDLLLQYDNAIKDQLANGIIERVTETDAESDAQAHYLPHHGVVKQDRETTKLRVVYDGSAKSPTRNYSINDCLLTGPNLIPHIFDILTRFRINPIGLVADIEKAFLMISIEPKDRDMLRFLWFDDCNSSDPRIVEYRFCRLVFGLRPSPAILGSTIKHHLDQFKEKNPQAVETIANSLYVDDFVSGVKTEEEGFTVYKESKEILKAGGFNLRKWNTNSQELLDTITIEENKHAKSTTTKVQNSSDVNTDNKEIPDDGTQPKTTKILGVEWDTETDEFNFNFNELIEYARSLPATKRSVLKATSKIFDPVGFLTPFTIKLKSLFQELCKMKASWDDKLECKMKTTWDNFVLQLNTLSVIKLQRCYFDQNKTPIAIELHGFSDASEIAFAAVVYVRVVYDTGDISVRLVASKSKVAPIKKQTIPRLELLGATILARLVNKLTQSMPELSTSIFLWVDSITTLCWIVNNRHWKQYVQHRVDEIRRLTDRESWRYCPGKQNPADLPSRGLSARDLASCAFWWNGPEFLYLKQTQWPRSPVANNDSTAMEEIVKNRPEVTHSLITTSKEHIAIDVSKVIDCERFHSLKKLLRVTAYVLRFIDVLKKRRKATNDNQELTAQDIRRAETLWIQSVQSTVFTKELNFLHNSTTSMPIYVKQFDLFLDDQHVMKCKGRIENAPLDQASKNPILLPSRHVFTELVIKDIHERVHHSGLNTTLTTIRERFWIIKGRYAVKLVLKSCTICRKLEGSCYQSPQTPDLPKFRVSDAPPFTHTGIDFAGPLYVKGFDVTDDSEQLSKAYVCLFTCASTRAVHLELVRTLTVHSFLNAFRRFASRRNLPAILVSDNAKTFKSAAKEIQRISRSPEVHRYLTDNQIQWTFIVEKAPWWGGFWERMVQSVKRCLRKSIGRATLTFDCLNTLLIEIETIINSRPLTYVNDDQNGTTYALTPSHLINGRQITNTPNASYFEILSTHQTLQRRAKGHRHILTEFTKSWRKDYLLGLREVRSRATTKNRPTISIGDIVVLKNDSTKRAFWKIATVVELLKGNDGQTRAAAVRVGSTEGRPRILRRSVKHLFPIEAKVNCNEPEVDHSSTNDTCNADITQPAETNNNRSNRPRRAAAIQGELARRKNIS